MKTLEEQQQLSESLLAACKAAGIEEPKYIAQDEDGTVWHYDGEPDTTVTSDIGIFAFDADIGEHAIKLDHPPYADDWQYSLMEWVDHVTDTSKMIDDACKIAYRKYLEKPYVLQTATDNYRAGWQDALALRDGGNQASGIEAMVCDDIAKRQQVGIAKYGTTVDENPLSHIQWLQHAYEECLDMAVYLKRAMTEKGGSDD